ncbi:MAG: bifunctional tRNA (5-methylaminomethyl-2-thiouridine)(34)-methyltransferase MnmD/FAD-dependent 5-carboxymethylaminomethyl-2-thiouridine(34) oxidoreductase MnmC [Gammaproteobacteria bacterium]
MDFASIEWRNGQPYSEKFDDVYYSINNGLAESDYVFLQQNGLHQRFACANHFVIAETGFGTGLNFALTLQLWDKIAPATAQLDYFGIEFAPLSPDDIRRVAARWPELAAYFSEFINRYPLPVAGRHMYYVLNDRVRLHLCFMDICDALQSESLAVDAWYLDGFSPAKNPEIFNHRVFGLLAQNSAPNATLATYSAAGFVRRGLVEAGFSVEKRKGHGNKREMIMAQFPAAGRALVNASPWTQLPQPVQHSKHAVIIGAGLAGLSAAWSLIRRGWRISLIDHHAEVAGEASGNPVGLVLPRLSVDDAIDTQFYRAAFLHAITELDNLQAQYSSLHDRPVAWCKQGVYLGMRLSRADRMLERNDFHADFIQPAVNNNSGINLPADSGLLFMPSAGWASPELLCRDIRDTCGDALQYHQAEVVSLVQDVRKQGNVWQCLSLSRQLIAESEVLILANGTNAAKFQQTQWMPVSSVRGQLTELSLKQGVTACAPACSFEHYLAPSVANERRYFCGASYHPDDSCEALRDSDQHDNIEFAEKLFPGMFEVPVQLQGRTGFRAVSEDRMPLVGPIADLAWFEHEYHDLCHGRAGHHYPTANYLPGLYVTAAHGSRGMTSCFISAEVIAAQIEGTPLPLARNIVDLLNPARFIIRRLKRGD